MPDLTKTQKKAIRDYKDSLKPKEVKRLKQVVKYLKSERIEDQLADILHPDDAHGVRDSIRNLHSSSFLSDPVAATQEVGVLQDRLKQSISRLPIDAKQKAFNLINGGNPVGYDPAGSILRRLYPNPFAVFAFLGDNYWAAWRSRREVRVEVKKDGVYFKTLQGTSRRKVRVVWQLLSSLGLLDKRDELVDHLNLFGNAWLRPIYNVLGGLLRYEILQPERIMPRWDANGENIIAWEYQINGKRRVFEMNELIHLKTYSARTQQLGTPALSSVVVDMEASIFASIFNNTVFQKGGMIGSIVSLKGMDTGSLINDKNFSLLADAVQARFEKKYAGVKGSGQILISPFVDKVFKLMSIGEMDGSFKTMTEATDRKVALLLCCAPEKIGIPMTSQYQDKGLVNDRISESFDNNVNYLCGIVDAFLNKVIEEVLGIFDVRVLSGGAYKSQAVAMAQYIKLLTEAGGILTRDEARELLKREPFGGDMGRMLLDNSAARVNNKPTTTTSATGGTSTGGEIPPAELGPALPNYDFATQKAWRFFSEEQVRMAA